MYFTRTNPRFPFPNTFSTILVSRFDGGWRSPEVVSFSGLYSDIDPFISTDGARLYYMSDRPRAGSPPGDFDLWYVDRTATGWSEPRNPGPPVNSDWWDGFPSVARDGTLYFFSARPGGHGMVDIYRAASRPGGRFAEPENLGPRVNGDSLNTNVYVDPDQRYIIFSAIRPEGYGGMDLYASAREGDEWTTPTNLGPDVNTAAWEFTPVVSPEGRFLFFTRAAIRSDTRAESGARVRTAGELEDFIAAPGNGLGDIFYVELSALGLP